MDNSAESKSSSPAGGSLPVIQYWAEQTLSPQGLQLWQTLNHESACLCCTWGTGGQKGGFINEAEEYLQRCAKSSVEAITTELQPGIKQDFFQHRSISELQQLTSQECDHLGKLMLSSHSQIRFIPLSTH
jgi:hypothetical protein